MKRITSKHPPPWNSGNGHEATGDVRGRRAGGYGGRRAGGGAGRAAGSEDQD